MTHVDQTQEVRELRGSAAACADREPMQEWTGAALQRAQCETNVQEKVMCYSKTSKTLFLCLFFNHFREDEGLSVALQPHPGFISKSSEA